MELILYSREECHLCEEALTLLEHVGLGGHVTEVDIESDESLLRRYCVQIPVLHHPASGKEMGWPFDMNDVEVFINDIPS